MSYAQGKFHAAVLSIAIAHSQKEWLTSEAIYRIVRLKADDLPEPLHEEFHSFKQAMTVITSHDVKASIEATVLAMAHDEVSVLIGRIIHMYETIRQHENRHGLQADFRPGIDSNKQAPSDS